MAGISLNAGIRASLTQLSRTTAAFDQTTNRLATGKSFSAIDNPTNFFASVNLNDRAEGLSSRLDSMDKPSNEFKQLTMVLDGSQLHLSNERCCE